MASGSADIRKHIINQKRSIRRSGPFKTLDHIAGSLLNDAKTRCKKRKEGICMLTREWIKEKLVEGCALTGLPFEFHSSGGPLSRSPSLDRINSSNKDYTIENCRVVCYQVNCALNKFSEMESLPILEALVLGLKQKIQPQCEVYI